MHHIVFAIAAIAPFAALALGCGDDDRSRRAPADGSLPPNDGAIVDSGPPLDGTTIDEDGAVPTELAAHAGPDLVVEAVTTVVLDGSASTGAPPLAFSWSQTSGPPVTLDDPTAPTLSFEAPNADVTIELELVVTDATGTSAPDSVSVQVLRYGGDRAELAGHPFRVLEALPTTEARDVARRGDLIAVADGDGGLALFDMSDTTNIHEVGRHALAFGATRVALVAGYALVMDEAGTLYVVDVSTPASPRRVQSFDCAIYGTSRLAIAGDYAFAVGTRFCGLRIVDISDPATASLVTTYPLTEDVFGLAADGTFAYVATNNSFDGTVEILDVSTPASPTPVASFTTRWRVTTMAALGGKLYVGRRYFGSADGGVEVWDVSSPTAPVRLGEGATLRGVAALAPTTGGLVAVGSSRDLAAYDVRSLPTSFGPLVFSYDPGLVSGADFDGTWLCIAAATNGLRVVERRPRVDAPFTFNDPLADSFWTMAVADDSVLVSHGSTLERFDTTTATMPTTSGTASVAPRFLSIDGDRAAALSTSGGRYDVTLLDIADPSSPRVLGTLAGSGLYASGVALAGDVVLVATTTSSADGALVIDASDPSVMAEVARWAPLEPIDAVAASGNVAYIAASNRLDLVDISDPSAPSMLSSLAPTGITDFDAPVRGHLYGRQGGRLQVVDVSDPAAPTLGARLVVGSGRHWTTSDGIAAAVPSYPDLTFAAKVYDLDVPHLPATHAELALDDRVENAHVVGSALYVVTPSSDWSAYPIGGEVTLSPLLVRETAGTTHPYTVHWNDGYPGDDRVRCFTSAGACTVTTIDAAARTATVDWTLPTDPGDYELAVVVGQYSGYVIARDRVRAQ